MTLPGPHKILPGPIFPGPIFQKCFQKTHFLKPWVSIFPGPVFPEGFLGNEGPGPQDGPGPGPGPGPRAPGPMGPWTHGPMCPCPMGLGPFICAHGPWAYGSFILIRSGRS